MMLNFQELNKYQKCDYILVNIQLVLGVFGIVGNILTICVFSRRSLRGHSYSFYWRIMAFSDTIIMIESIRNWSNFLLHPSFIPLWAAHIDCILGDFLIHCSGYVSVWLNTIISVDRLVVIAYPSRLRIVQKRSTQITLVFILVAYSVLLNIRMPLNFRLEVVNLSLSSSSNNMTSQLVCYKPLEIQNETGLSIILNCILVHILNSLVDFKLIKAIRASKRKLYRYVYNLRWTIRDRKFAISSIAMNIASFVLLMPFAVGMYLSSYLHSDLELKQMIHLFTVLIVLVNYSNIFLINLLVNSIFYTEFRRMIRFN